MIEIIEQEIKWTNKHGGESGKSEDFEVGFVAGLKQALYLLNAAEQSVQTDGAKCAAPDCENPGIYNIWLCGDHGNPPRR